MMGQRNKPIFGASVVDWVAPPSPNVQDLSGGYAILERLDAASHSQELFEANLQSDQIWDYLPYGPFKTEPSYRAWIEEVALQSDPTFFAIRNRTSGRSEGVASYLRIAPEAGSIEVGHINFSPRLQRTAAATEAIYLMMNWAFEAGYRRFEWKCDALNLASCRAAQRFGFSYEGVFRQATVVKGRNRDTAWFACIDKEWSELRAAYEAWLDPTNFDDDGGQLRSLADLTGPVLVARDPRTS